MSTLFGAGAQLAPAPLDAPPESEHKRPGVAFLLSLLFPGLGHLYCRKTQIAAITAGFFVGTSCAVIFLKPTGMFWGVSLRAALVLYMFGFLDAYYTAREINAGISQYIVGNNPRIAATLNLLTNGFGYFYLGERTKGLVCFLLLRVVGSAGAEQRSHLLLIALEVIAVGMAADAYRVARNQLRAAFPEQPASPFTLQDGLSPWVPAALGIFFVFNYVVLVVVGLMAPSYAGLAQSDSAIDNTSIPRTYRNATYGVEMKAPEGWEFSKGEPPFMVQVETLKGGCNVSLIPAANLPWRGLVGDGHFITDEVVKQNKGFRLMSERPAELSGKPAHEMVFAAKFNDVEVIQRYIITQRRLSMYGFVETFATVLADRCQPAFEEIEAGLKLPN